MEHAFIQPRLGLQIRVGKRQQINELQNFGDVPNGTPAKEKSPNGAFGPL
jgi:hypothetical protein